MRGAPWDGPRSHNTARGFTVPVDLDSWEARVDAWDRADQAAKAARREWEARHPWKVRAFFDRPQLDDPRRSGYGGGVWPFNFKLAVTNYGYFRGVCRSLKSNSFGPFYKQHAAPLLRRVWQVRREMELAALDSWQEELDELFKMNPDQ